MNILPRDIARHPRVLGSDLIDYLTTPAPDPPDGWDPLAEAAEVIDPDASYTASLEATPGWSVTRWTPPAGSGLPVVAICAQGEERTVLIEYRRR